MRKLSWNPVQMQILADPSPKIFAEGGFRSGKTYAMLFKITQLVRTMPGSPVIIGRDTLKEMKKDIYSILFGKDGLWEGLGTFNKADNLFIFYNGSKCYFTHFDNEENARGGEAAIVYINQAETIREEVFNTLSSRLSYWNPSRVERYKKEFKGNKKVIAEPRHFFFMDANPSPKSFLKRMFIEASPQGWSIYHMPTNVNETNLPDNYIDTLCKDKSEQWINRYIKSSWDQAGGLVYPEFIPYPSPGGHIVQPFKFPHTWKRVCAIDPGYTHPAGVLFTVLSPDNVLYCYDEIKITDKTPYEVADMIHAVNAKWTNKQTKQDQEAGIRIVPNIYLVDYAANQKNKLSGKTEADIFREKGIPVQNADKTAAGADGGRMRVKNSLKAKKIMVFAGLTNLIQEFSLHIWHPTKPDEVVKTDDDLLDPLRYIVNKTYKPLPEVEKFNPVITTAKYVSEKFWKALKPAKNKPTALFQDANSDYKPYGL